MYNPAVYYLKNFISGTRSQKRKNLGKIKTKKYSDLCFFLKKYLYYFVEQCLET